MRGESVKFNPSFKHDTKHIGLPGVQGCSVSPSRGGFIQKKTDSRLKMLKARMRLN